MFIPLGCLWTGLLLLEWLLWATSAFGLEELGDTVGLGVGLDLEISLVDTEGLADWRNNTACWALDLKLSVYESI